MRIELNFAILGCCGLNYKNYAVQNGNGGGGSSFVQPVAPVVQPVAVALTIETMHSKMGLLLFNQLLWLTRNNTH